MHRSVSGSIDYYDELNGGESISTKYPPILNNNSPSPSPLQPELTKIPESFEIEEEIQDFPVNHVIRPKSVSLCTGESSLTSHTRRESHGFMSAGMEIIGLNSLSIHQNDHDDTLNMFISASSPTTPTTTGRKSMGRGIMFADSVMTNEGNNEPITTSSAISTVSFRLIPLRRSFKTNSSYNVDELKDEIDDFGDKFPPTVGIDSKRNSLKRNTINDDSIYSVIVSDDEDEDNDNNPLGTQSTYQENSRLSAGNLRKTNSVKLSERGSLNLRTTTTTPIETIGEDNEISQLPPSGLINSPLKKLFKPLSKYELNEQRSDSPNNSLEKSIKSGEISKNNRRLTFTSNNLSSSAGATRRDSTRETATSVAGIPFSNRSRSTIILPTDSQLSPPKSAYPTFTTRK